MKPTHILILILLSVATQLNSQNEDFTIEKCKETGILSDLTEKGGVLIRPIIQDYISSWDLEDSEYGKPVFLSSSSFDFSQSEKSTFPAIEQLNTINHLSLNDDSTYVLSILNNGKYDLFISESGKKPQRIFKGSLKSQNLHPFITEDGDQIFFSSNSGNHLDNYDIFLINKLEDSWSTPIRLNTGVNDLENQFYPTFYDDTLYFSTELEGSLEIMSSAKQDQFKTSTKLEAPFNSSEDDFLLHKKNNQLYYLTSNRENSADVPYVVTRNNVAVKEKMLISGYLACSGNRISNIPISLESVFGIRMDNDITDAEGNFLLRSDKSIKRYKLKLDKKDSRIKDCAVLYLTDRDGNVIQKILVNEENAFIFEIIDPDDIKDLQFKSVEDESLLQIELDGQIYENTPGDIGKGEPVRILSEDGKMIALAYTSPDGSFKFSDLSPDSKYNLKFDENSKQLKLNIIKDGEIIPVPIKNNEAIYERIAEENAIDIIDDRGKNITISKDEFFNLQNIFYENNSSQLSEIAKFQLDRFSKLLFNNDEISVELISHTDSKGEDSYNFNLSEKRSKKALEHLVSIGVNGDKVTATGKGETELLNRCSDGVNCTEEEHAINRRTEIKIVIK